MAITEQFSFDFSAPLIDDHSITQPSPGRVLAVLETPTLSAEQPQYGVFLPKRMRDEISRNNGGRISQGRSL